MDDQRAVQLIKMPEYEASKLSLDEQYDRIRLLREKIGIDIVNANKLNKQSISDSKTLSNIKFWGPGHPSYDEHNVEK